MPTRPSSPDGERFTDDPGDQEYPVDDSLPEREVITTPYDPPVKSLLDDIRDKSLVVNPDFQRGSVWDTTRKSRLIESLLLNIPIPVIFLAEDPDGTRVVVDGQQRLRAIEEFERGQYRLRGLKVMSGLNGKRWVDLSPRQSRVIMNRTLRCIVISAKSDRNLRFEVFERLNSSGIPLNDQELRNSVYRGPFNRLLDALAHSQSWLSLADRGEPDKRLQHHEMILRYFAMHDNLQDYRPPLKAWLSGYMEEHRHDDAAAIARLRTSAEGAFRSVGAVFGTQGAQPFRRARALSPGGEITWDATLNRPAYELQMLGLEEAPTELLEARGPEIVRAFAELCIDDSDFADAISRATADRTRTRLRFSLWSAKLTAIGVPNTLADRLPSSD